MKIGYADPPYPGCAHLYKDHADYGGEVDHRQLVERLQDEFDGWVLHTSTPGLRMMEREHILPPEGVRIHQWFKPFAAFKRNVSVAYAYEPVIVKVVRKPVVTGRCVMRDWIEHADPDLVCEVSQLLEHLLSSEGVRESITMKRGLTGAKPEKVCHWIFEMIGAQPDDELFDLFPGTGAVTRAWETWRQRVAAAA